MNAAATTTQPSQEDSLFVGENLDIVIPPDRLYDHSDEFCLRKLCRRNSSAVCKLPTRYDPTLSTMAGELARKIAADLETRLLMAAQQNDGNAAQISSSSCVRHHRPTVLQWAGNLVSAADNPNQIVVASADAKVALKEAYVKCKILHGNISDRAILFQAMADGVKGVLGEFDYASHAENSAVESPELMLFQSIRSLKGIGVTLVTNEKLAEMESGDIPAALREILSIDGRRDSLILSDTFENKIVEKLLQVLAEHRNAATTTTDTI
ncbi:hypothetical protein GGH13_005214 [Coemansia sp. S155-1]|nr:hypothetical protein GGH13_005214 [Coemansia sp. S155-1]